tara:strand:+ start:280 stop:546 length:267 start_codon:yes stop_codon:yes gene_type:complete
MNGYEKAKSIDPIPRKIVDKLNCSKIKNAKIHRIKLYNNDLFIEISLFANGLFFVLSTFLSISLSTISFMMHPALLIKTDPQKNKIKK